MRANAKKQWLLPAFVVAGALCLFLIASKLNTPANARTELLTGINSEILVIPVQMGRDSYGLAIGLLPENWSSFSVINLNLRQHECLAFCEMRV